jgi:hypothetical protein
MRNAPISAQSIDHGSVKAPKVPIKLCTRRRIAEGSLENATSASLRSTRLRPLRCVPLRCKAEVEVRDGPEYLALEFYFESSLSVDHELLHSTINIAEDVLIQQECWYSCSL